uniref:Uncharacterized protein n=1 Tax=Branchiostoma floridae TaxID=7739 RepID=C3ZX95_BRAFL|eukprot:XP_002586842.1 hypothetical protein BRAFLDRAFT_105587 [Branchiostoma floridae]
MSDLIYRHEGIGVSRGAGSCSSRRQARPCPSPWVGRVGPPGWVLVGPGPCARTHQPPSQSPPGLPTGADRSLRSELVWENHDFPSFVCKVVGRSGRESGQFRVPSAICTPLDNILGTLIHLSTGTTGIGAGTTALGRELTVFTARNPEIWSAIELAPPSWMFMNQRWGIMG